VTSDPVETLANAKNILDDPNTTPDMRTDCLHKVMRIISRANMTHVFYEQDLLTSVLQNAG
jgi:hypothetical protein